MNGFVKITWGFLRVLKGQRHVLCLPCFPPLPLILGLSAYSTLWFPVMCCHIWQMPGGWLWLGLHGDFLADDGNAAILCCSLHYQLTVLFRILSCFLHAVIHLRTGVPSWLRPQKVQDSIFAWLPTCGRQIFLGLWSKWLPLSANFRKCVRQIKGNISSKTVH